MTRATEIQFNNHFSVVPPELFGKEGAARFTHRGKRFSATKILSAALLSTRQNVLGSGCTTSYADFEKELHFARSTTARNVAELTHGGTFKRDGQSKYTAAYSVDIKHGVPVYHFLRTEEFNGKRLCGNAVLYLSIIIRFYMNPEREQKYFIGGEKRAAKTLNVPESTAHGVIDELLRSDCILRFVLHDGKISEGKGINADYLTVYVVNDKILKTVKKIRKEINKQNSDKEEFKKLFAPSAQAEPKPAKPKKGKRNIIAQWQSVMEEMQAEELTRKYKDDILKTFACDFAFNQLKRDYITTYNKYFAALRQSGGAASIETQETERQLDSILTDVLNYLMSHNIRREELPDDWKQFIRDLLNT